MSHAHTVTVSHQNHSYQEMVGCNVQEIVAGWSSEIETTYTLLAILFQAFVG